MVLMSDTGGGHRASAEALQAGFEQLYGNDFQVCLTQWSFPILFAEDAAVIMHLQHQVDECLFVAGGLC